MFQKYSFILLIVLFSACSTKQKSKETAVTYEQKTMVISFISKGSGKNSALYTKTKELITNFKCDTEFPVTYNPWGREGEIDICIKITPACYSKLLQEIKTLVGSDELVQIKENGVCRQ